MFKKLLKSMMKISVITDISDISEKYRRIFWKKILVSKKLIKTHGNIKKPCSNVIRSIIDNLKLFC